MRARCRGLGATEHGWQRPQPRLRDLRRKEAAWRVTRVRRRTPRDLLALKEAGGWGSVALVERYARLLPEGQEAAIRRVWGISDKQERMRA